LSNSEKFAIVSAYELLESGNIPILGGVDKIQVIVCHFPHCELCRVYSHIRALGAATRCSVTRCPRLLEA